MYCSLTGHLPSTGEILVQFLAPPHEKRKTKQNTNIDNIDDKDGLNYTTQPARDEAKCSLNFISIL